MIDDKWWFIFNNQWLMLDYLLFMMMTVWWSMINYNQLSMIDDESMFNDQWIMINDWWWLMNFESMINCWLMIKDGLSMIDNHWLMITDQKIITYD